ncbi:MAG: chorismate mutase [Candidatus Nanoarchaeia archaeon]|nr:chorismate mutase [Candidatus Nanoarchaeia archaeon]
MGFSKIDIKKERVNIDKIDREIIKLLAKRKKICQKIIKYRTSKGGYVRDLKREKEMLKNRKHKEMNLDGIFKEIIKESRRVK